jgi:hypothetical protein
MIRGIFKNKLVLSILFVIGLSQSEASENDIYGIKIGFLLRHCSLRGTEIASYDYADFNETLLGNESFVFLLTDGKYLVDQKDYPSEVKAKFKDRFQDHFFECANFDQVEEIIREKKIDILYNLKSGRIDSHLSKFCKNAIHAVFLPFEIHGNVYATISNWMSQQTTGLNIPVVPHLVRLADTSETLHAELGIPPGAVVFGRHGGYDTFDIDFAKKAIQELATAYPEWYFVFLNTNPFCTLSNVIFLPGTSDLNYKTKFINTCDAMIHARLLGETFGLSCAEFSVKNKPVITYWGSQDRAHIDILGSYGLYYNDEEGLRNLVLFCGANIQEIRLSKWDAYSEQYSPTVVMQQFDRIFIRP